MALFYHLLGIAAGIGEWLSRKSVNFVQLNWVLLGALGFWFMTSAQALTQLLTTEPTLTTTTVSSLANYESAKRPFVEVEGLLFPDSALQYGTISKSNPEALDKVTQAWAPLKDLETDDFIMVELANKRLAGEPRQVKLRGMLIEQHSALASKLREPEMQNAKVNRYFALAEGQVPQEPYQVWIAVGISAVLFGSVLFAWMQRYSIFRRQSQRVGDPLAVTGDSDEYSVVHATGSFTLLDDGTKKRFVRVPCAISVIDDGRIAICANVDASSHFFGLKVADRSGIWAIIHAPSEIHRLEIGNQYFGVSRYPALRMSVTTARVGSPAPVLSFETVASRRSVMRAFASKSITAQYGT